MVIFYLIASIENVETFKILNVFGLALDLFGVILLSNLVLNKSKSNGKLFDYIYAFFYAGTLNIPLGMVLGAGALFLLDLPSSTLLVSVASGVLAYVGAPLFVFDYFAEIVKLKFYETVTTRMVFMGWYLLLAGLAMQLVAAILDMTG